MSRIIEKVTAFVTRKVATGEELALLEQHDVMENALARLQVFLDAGDTEWIVRYPEGIDATLELVPLTVGAMAGTLLSIPLALAILWTLQYTVQAKDRKVFRYNVTLFAVGIAIFAIGAIVETFVLHNSGALQHVYGAAAGFA